MQTESKVYTRTYKLAQFHGGSDHFWVTVPTPWVRAKGLKRGDKLVVEINSDGSLTIKTLQETQATQEQREN